MESPNDNKEIINDKLNTEKHEEAKVSEIRNEASVLQLDTSDTFDIYLDKTKPSANVDDNKSTDKPETIDKHNLEELSIIPCETLNADDNLKIDENLTQFTCIDSLQNKKPESGQTTNTTTDIKMKEKNEKPNLNCIWVYNISKTTKATDLKSHLSKFGKIISTKIVTDGENCYGYSILNKYEDVKRCIANLDNTYFEGKKIKLSHRNPEKQSRMQKNRSPTKSLTRKFGAPQRKSSRESSMSHRRRMSTERTRYLSTEKRRSRERSKDRPKTFHKKSFRGISRERSRKSPKRPRDDSRERYEKRKRNYEDWQEEMRRKALEINLKDARNKLEKEKVLFQKEKMQLLKLQKIFADYERIDLKKQTDIIKKETRELEENLMKCKTSETDRKMEIGRKYYGTSPPKKLIRYEDKKLHISPPPPPNICKETLEHKLAKKRYEDDKLLNDERSYQRYQYNGKQEHYKEHIHHNAFNKYNQTNNKKPTELPRCNNASSIPKNVTWKQIGSSSAHHGNETYPSEFWKEPPPQNQRYRPILGESSNFSPSFYHYPEYSRYGYHEQDNARKF